MRKILLTLCAFPEGHIMNDIFNNHIKPNFLYYANKHNFEFVVIDKDVVSPRHIHWAKFDWIKNNTSLKDGDIVTYIDSDSIIMNFDIDFVFDKNFSIPIESTGIMCMGFFSIKICDWSKCFIDKMINKEPECNTFFNDNDAFYKVLDLTFGDSFIGDENINILPTEYNVTIFIDELIDKEDSLDQILSTCYKKEFYVPYEKIIIRHLAGKQIYKDYAKKYFNSNTVL